MSFCKGIYIDTTRIDANTTPPGCQRVQCVCLGVSCIYTNALIAPGLSKGTGGRAVGRDLDLAVLCVPSTVVEIGPLVLLLWDGVFWDNVFGGMMFLEMMFWMRVFEE